MIFDRIIKFALVLSILMCLSFITMAQGEPTRKITEIADNLLWVQNNNHYSIVLVTEEGIEGEVV